MFIDIRRNCIMCGEQKERKTSTMFRCRHKQLSSVVTIKKVTLNGQLESVGGLVNLQFEPVAALATLRFALEDPEPLDICVLFVTHAADHSVGVHSVDDVRILLSSLSPLPGLQKERILKRNKKSLRDNQQLFAQTADTSDC